MTRHPPPLLAADRQPAPFHRPLRWTQPLRQATRRLWRNPHLAWPIVALLGLALGAVGATFSLVDSVLLRPLPYAHPDRLVMLWAAADDAPAPPVVSWPEVLDWRRHSRSLQAIAAFNIAEEHRRDGERRPGSPTKPSRPHGDRRSSTGKIIAGRPDSTTRAESVAPRRPTGGRLGAGPAPDLAESLSPMAAVAGLEPAGASISR